MTMAEKRRVDLGFDDDSDESGSEEVLVPRKVQKKTTLPKFTFKTDKIQSNDVDDIRPSLGESQTVDGNKIASGSDDDDYMNIQIQEDETTRPQSLRSKEEPRLKPQYEFEKIGQDQKDKLKQTPHNNQSLFGQIIDDDHHEKEQEKTSEDEDDSHFDIDVIRPISTHAKSSSKGLSIMEKMGFKIGDTLGIDKKNKDALLEPLQLVNIKGREGIKEHKADPKIEAKIPKDGLTEEQTKLFRERLIAEDAEAVKERLLHKMQKLCWQLTGGADIPNIETVNPLDVNVLWRGYVKFILKMKRESKERNQITEILDSPKSANNDDEIKLDEIESNGSSNDQEKKNDNETISREEEDEEDDDELLMFQELSLDAQIEKLYMFLRTDFDYCYYCGTRYINQTDLFSHCPGLTPEDHQ
ncbi:Tuftelin-interacting protein 11 [Wickerhamomyces ciferrii]|uniref:Tuftelin-interacting protein 11 n=1 Tax=Wickerhamomyces ciferrii (strain ATCC 14091 / BCRC 22168 / CBS 111 / JCM 3599 / NBRC 0793 / NRRL Y-1031 F-60-10) TaxID=1206466 RepID=K0KG36_WICCF|nr:Tuftelin-interacting protein 11 [Wickerhamomyces ciferrii]CCH41906.1 Tuftelin-interacting protein 11 [Wickerhamomyces ciferrii]